MTTDAVAVSPAAAEIAAELPMKSWDKIERAILMAPGETIRPEHTLPPPALTEGTAPEPPSVPPPLAETERRAVLHALEYTGGNKAAAARILGINVKTLSRKIEGHASPDR